MKNFLKFMTIALAIGFFAACSKDGEQAELVSTTESHADLINNELAQYSNVEGIAHARKVLVAFDKTLTEATTLEYDFEAGELFTKNAAAAGLVVYNDFESYRTSFANKAIPEVPTKLIELIGKFAELAKADTVDMYLTNVDALINEARTSGLELKYRGPVVVSLVILKVIGKIIKAATKDKPAPSVDAKWRKQLKCAIKSIASGLAGGTVACTKGAKVVGGIGTMFGSAQGGAIGSLVGCTVGGVIGGLKDLITTAIQCSKDEGLTKKD